MPDKFCLRGAAARFAILAAALGGPLVKRLLLVGVLLRLLLFLVIEAGLVPLLLRLTLIIVFFLLVVGFAHLGDRAALSRCTGLLVGGTVPTLPLRLSLSELLLLSLTIIQFESLIM